MVEQHSHPQPYHTPRNMTTSSSGNNVHDIIRDRLARLESGKNNSCTGHTSHTNLLNLTNLQRNDNESY